MSLRLYEGSEPVAGYVLERLLGSGGFGEVWKAIAPGGIPVAMKFIRLESGAASIEERALQTVCTLRHPFLLEMHWAQRIEDRLVIATSLCDGSLADRLAECRNEGLVGIPLPELLDYMDQVARALESKRCAT